MKPGVVRRHRGQPLPANTKYVGRPGKYGNPWKVGEDGSREDCVGFFNLFIRHAIDDTRVYPEYANIIEDLQGKNLACWCHDWDGEGGNPMYCHADILLEIVREL